ncbi:MAG: nicotinate (nicotinamide) nucleotide adenylyltransferase [Oscillospiraceae bacterium]|nr:nicotinate (nicotinamide) nucleotide adenylyltransferase [Oscillospiraceae bacterium]
MRIGIYGGSFNPPHAGHVHAAENAVKCLSLDELIIMPAREPPHKTLSANSPTPAERAVLCELAFSPVAHARVSTLELEREEVSYTADTVSQLRAQFPDAEFFLLLGTDMLASFTSWYAFETILQNCALAVFCRAEGDEKVIAPAVDELREKFGARITFVPFPPIDASSTDLRAALAEAKKPADLPEAVYAEIIRLRCYGAKPEPEWLRAQSYACLKPNRIPHVRGTELTAVHLAERWGANVEDAAEAAILHDITKKLDLNEQLLLCERYGIINDTSEAENAKLLHAKTGAAFARERFGVSDAVYDAIRWHTTGRAGMTLLEKVIYMADYIEPNRDFPGVEKLRALAESDLDAAMILGLEMSLEDLRSYGISPHVNSLEALDAMREICRTE